MPHSGSLKNTLQFDLAPGASVTLEHDLATPPNTGRVPDIIHLPSPDLSVVATATTITLTNNGGAQLSGAVLVEYWHTIERDFPLHAANLPVKPYIVVSVEGGNAPAQPQFQDPPVTLRIYVRATGSDTTGTGQTALTAYKTIQRAAQDIPSFIPGGVYYIIDATGLGVDTSLPDGYALPAWKAPHGVDTDFAAPMFSRRAAVAIEAEPQLVASLGANATITSADLVPTVIGTNITIVEVDPEGSTDGSVRVTTQTAHGLWNSGFPIQEVTIAGVTGTIAAVVNGTKVVFVTSPTQFYLMDTDGTGLAYGGGGTVSTLFVQDANSGHVQVKTTKNFGAVDSLVGKLLVSNVDSFFNAVIYHNTADTLFLSNSFATPVFPGAELRVMEQSCELVTTYSGGEERGGFNAANIDSLALNGLKITPANPGEVGLHQFGSCAVMQGCHLTQSRHVSAKHEVLSLWSHLDNPANPGSIVNWERCLIVNKGFEEFTGPVGWLFARLGTVLENCEALEYDTTVSQDLFAVKFRNSPGPVAIFYVGKNTWNRISLENIGGDFALGASGTAARNRLEVVNGTMANPGAPFLFAVNGGMFLVTADNERGCFTAPGDSMSVDGLPTRTFEDFRQHALLDLGALTPTLDSVFEASSPWTSSPVALYGDPPSPSIEVVAGGALSVVDNMGTGLVTITFVAGVDTTTTVEAAVDAGSSLIRTKTPGSGAVLVVGDALAATPLVSGVNGPCGEYTNIRPNTPASTGTLGTRAAILAYTLS